MPKSEENAWIFLINPEITPIIFKLAPELYHKQFSIFFLHKQPQIFVNVVISKY
jgi:hypothetical protein